MESEQMAILIRVRKIKALLLFTGQEKASTYDSVSVIYWYKRSWLKTFSTISYAVRRYPELLVCSVLAAS